MKVGILVRCVVCGNAKKPVGRSGPLDASYCDDECAGYRQPPFVGSLWPGETEEQFGYPVGSDGTAEQEQATMYLGRDVEHGGYPTSETRTIGQMRRDADAYAGIGRRRQSAVTSESKKGVDIVHAHVVGSLQSHDAATETNVIRSSQMTLTFKALSKNGKNAFYSGAANVLRFPIAAFVNKQHPTTIEIVGEGGDLAPAKAARVQMTAEERKAARAARPKPTTAERLEIARKRAEKLAAELAKEQSDAPQL